MKDIVSITLTPEELVIGKNIGTAKRQSAIRNGRVSRNNMQATEEEKLLFDIEGAQAELACAYYLQEYCVWDMGIYEDDLPRNLPDYTTFDGKIKLDAKCCPGPNTNNRKSLILQKDGHKDWIYILVWTEASPRYDIIGWCWGWEGMSGYTPSDPSKKEREAHFVPYNSPIIKKPIDLLHELEKKT